MSDLPDAHRVTPGGKLRARGAGIPFDGKPGPANAITDVPGVAVGYTTLIEGDGPLVVGQGPIRSGVTAILPLGLEQAASAVWAGVSSLNGNGEMTAYAWVDEAGRCEGPITLTNTHSVGVAAFDAGRRIASPEMLPNPPPLPHVICSPRTTAWGRGNGTGEHGYA